ncbi:MAG: pilus assembly protein [Deltaproteobacteria bacterium]|nr:pilus assembly protein [Deltaproteobacteria bacterium]
MEFALTLLFFFTIAFMFVQVSLGFGVANYIHYATFMTARAYLSSRQTEGDQHRAAQDVADRMLKQGEQARFRNIIKSATDGGGAGNVSIGGPRLVAAGSGEARDRNWEQGVTYAFKAKLYMMPVIRSNNPRHGNSITLESQSWLGREPSEEDCGAQMQKKSGLVDNGC